MAKRCLTPGCTRKLTDGRRHAFCAACWRQLPMVYRKAIWGAWDETQAHGEPGSSEFLAALGSATEHLNEKDP